MPDPETEDEYENLNALDRFNYEFATVEYDWRLTPDCSRRIMNMAKNLYEDAYMEGKETGDYLEGWQEGYIQAKREVLINTGDTI